MIQSLRGAKKPKWQKAGGGQQGHLGTILQPFANPDKINILQIDKESIPPGQYREVGDKSMQVIDLDITSLVQYGIGVKVNSVYMFPYQLIPYKRIEDHFPDQMQTLVSGGSLLYHRDIRSSIFSLTWIRLEQMSFLSICCNLFIAQLKIPGSSLIIFS